MIIHESEFGPDADWPAQWTATEVPRVRGGRFVEHSPADDSITFWRICPGCGMKLEATVKTDPGVSILFDRFPRLSHDCP